MGLFGRFKKEETKPENAFEYGKLFKQYFEDRKRGKAIKIAQEFYEKYPDNYCALSSLGIAAVLKIVNGSSKDFENGMNTINNIVDPKLKELKEAGLPALSGEENTLRNWFTDTYDTSIGLTEAKLRIKIRKQ